MKVSLQTLALGVLAIMVLTACAYKFLAPIAAAEQQAKLEAFRNKN